MTSESSSSPSALATAYNQIRVRQATIFYREAGERGRPTILLLHGFPSSSHMLRALIPRLAERYHVVAPDLPGFGHPTFQKYLRDYRPPLLAVWGKNDPFFLPPGADSFKRDIPDAEVHRLDTGHFALETHAEETAALILEFLSRKVRAATAR